MSNSKLKQIKDVVRNFDVRDPRAAIVAIADIINAKSLAAKQPKPVLTIKVFEQGDEIDVALKHVANIDPSIVLAAKEVIDQFGQNKFGKVIRDADSGELVGFEKFGEHNGIRHISDPECDCPACRLKAVLKEIGAKIEAKRAEGDTPGPIKIDTGVPGLEATVFTSIDDLMAHIKATDSGTTQGAN